MTTFSATIITSADDAQESGGTVTTNGGALNANNTNGYTGLRFQNVTIPAGSTINSAALVVFVTSTSFDDPDVTIYAEDTDDAATFSTAASNISGRAATTANAVWNAGGLGTGAKTSPDFAAVIQEIIDRPGWSSGNAIAVIYTGNDAGSLIRIRAYDAGGGDYATLNVDYTPGGGGGGQAVRTMHQFGQRVG